ncbi:hypothetical protein [Streptomyces sp. NPDC049887]|uniref:hypothetical protein n=1 Tax=Streptomyces sp. NPDC049887 TaxID=3155654 RepID=UPI00341FF3B6
MTAVVKHTTRKPLEITNPSAEQAKARNSRLREQFPARASQRWWPQTAQSSEETLRHLMMAPFLPVANGTRAGRRRGVIKLLRWLSPGDTWQQRWMATGAEELSGASWVEIPKRWLSEHGPSPSHDREDLAAGLLMLICGDVIRPALPWMLTRSHRYLASVMAETRDPHGFVRLRQLAAAGPASARQDAQTAATRIAILLACKGGRIDEPGIQPRRVVATYRRDRSLSAAELLMLMPLRASRRREPRQGNRRRRAPRPSGRGASASRVDSR